MRERYDMAVITNDIYTREDMEILLRANALPAERLMGVETGGCPHTAIREDASINLEAIARLQAEFPGLQLVLVESGGDNLAATFSPELSDLTLYVIDVAGGEKIPRKGGPGITRSDLLIINKTDLAPDDPGHDAPPGHGLFDHGAALMMAFVATGAVLAWGVRRRRRGVQPLAIAIVVALGAGTAGWACPCSLAKW